MYRQNFMELLPACLDHMAVYTDGSFVQGSAGGAFIHDDLVFSYHLYSFNNIFTAELYAMYQILLFAQNQSQQCNFVCMDSLSALQSLNGYAPDNPIIIEILIQVCHLHKSGKSVVFCWVPGHTGLPGNETASMAFKAATLDRSFTSDRALGCDVCAFQCPILMQDKWTNIHGNKLHVMSHPPCRCGTLSIPSGRRKSCSHACGLVTCA
jgi:ribonuclease HI